MARLDKRLEALEAQQGAGRIEVVRTRGMSQDEVAAAVQAARGRVGANGTVIIVQRTTSREGAPWHG